jgi:adenylyl- and sulfurtransferase ThiI
MKFENHEICEVVMISYVEVVVKNENVLKTLTRTLFRNRNISREVSKNLN